MNCFVLGCVYNTTIVILGVCGMLLMGSAVYMVEMFPQYGAEQNVTDITVVTIVVGAVTLASSIAMCVAVCSKHRCMLYVISLSSVVVFCFQLSAFLWLATQAKTEKVATISMKSYEKDQEPLDLVQREFECCGINAPTDWAESAWGQKNIGKLPASCCDSTSPEEPCDLNANTVHTAGCQNPLFHYMETVFNIIVAAMLIVCVFQFSTIFMSCCVARAFKDTTYDRLTD